MGRAVTRGQESAQEQCWYLNPKSTLLSIPYRFIAVSGSFFHAANQVICCLNETLCGAFLVEIQVDILKVFPAMKSPILAIKWKGSINQLRR